MRPGATRAATDSYGSEEGDAKFGAPTYTEGAANAAQFRAGFPPQEANFEIV